VPWKFVEKLFFSKGLIRDLILFGNGRQARFFFQKTGFFTHTFFFSKNIGLPRFLATIVSLPNVAGALNNLDFWHNGEPNY